MENKCDIKTPPKTFKERIRSIHFWKPVLAMIGGGILGYVYYYYVGCTSGSCAMTSNPYSSIFFGGILGLYIVNRPCKSC